MYIGILIILSTIILLSSKSNQTIIINENSHRWYNAGYEYINSKIVFVTKEESRTFYVFLNNILIIRSVYHSCVKGIFLSLSRWKSIHLLCLYTLLYFEIWIHFFFRFFTFLVERLSKTFNFWMNENTTALTSTLRFTNENNGRVSFALGFSHQTRFYFLLAFRIFLLGIFLNVMELCRIHPCSRKEVKMFRKLFLKTFEMHT